MKQSFAWWTFSKGIDNPTMLLEQAVKIGYQGVDLLPQQLWSIARDLGLVIVCVNGCSLTDGLNRKENHAQIKDEIFEKLILAAEFGIPNLIVFSGNRYGLSDETGAEITAYGLEQLAPEAESKGVTLILELLNSKVDHIDYQCDHTKWGVDVISHVNSENVKLLYDIYHMQIMEGDIIRTVKENISCFGHVHTAGNPGRFDLDNEQELNYPAIMRALKSSGYTGFVGQEFFPKGDAVEALAKAYQLCDV